VVLHQETDEVAVGFDDGVVVLQLSQDDPLHSMDPWQTRARIPLTTRELRSTEMYANAVTTPADTSCFLKFPFAPQPYG